MPLDYKAEFSPKEYSSWAATEYQISIGSIELSDVVGITGFTPPETNTNVVDVRGQGAYAIGWAEGNVENTTGQVQLHEDTYNHLLILAGDGKHQESLMRKPIKVTEIINPKSGDNKKETIYRGRINSISLPAREQGDTERIVTITFVYYEPSDSTIEDKSGDGD